MSGPNTMFLRLEGPLQAWGSHEAKFAIRRTAATPTRSGVFGLLCAALGKTRAEAGVEWLPKFKDLRLGVRVDRPGIRWWDFHTVGAGQSMRTAEVSEPKDLLKVGESLADSLKLNQVHYRASTFLSRREYLADASFLVALQGEPELINELDAALRQPKWVLYLGRKSCPPSSLVREVEPGCYVSPEAALLSQPWYKRYGEQQPDHLELVLDWIPTRDGEQAPADAEIHYDVPVSFAPPRHLPRFVLRKNIPLKEFRAEVAAADDVQTGKPIEARSWRPPRPSANYGNSRYKLVRAERLVMDNAACMVCKAPATTVQHVDYRRAGGNEKPEDLRALCRLCHDAVTMLEYGAGMTMDRIDPCLPEWRERILAKRAEIVRFRSLEQRRRKLLPEEENA